jgi:quercetin dioxygenase-like cupin family protein
MYNRAMTNITRRDTLAGAIALLCGLGAAEARAYARSKGQPYSSRDGSAPETPSAASPESPSKGQSGSSGAQGAERSGADLVFKCDLPKLTMADWEVTVSTVDYAPGRVGKVHHHAGFVLAYVLEGNIVTKVSGQEERTYKPGEMFYEPPGSTHEVSRNASETQPAKLLALIFAKKGAQLTMPGPA